MPFMPHTPDDERVMLETLGIESVGQLFDVIPSNLRLQRPLNLPCGLGEANLTRRIAGLAARNRGAEDWPCFLGGGAYDHFVPAAVDALASRGEFFTAYTPYQAEASQGTLQAIFEYQTLMAQMTGLDISNSSLYDGGSACAEAMLMALASTDRTGPVVVAGSVHPEYREVLSTFQANLPCSLKVVPARLGRVDPTEWTSAIDERTPAVIIQHPNVFGALEDLDALVSAAKSRGAFTIVSFDPISLGVLRKPGDRGADIAIAEGQSLGNHLSFGGPYLGIMACRESFARKLPGRIVGQTTDHDGKRCWVLTLQTREQHIRREKATSNICTNQGLMALRAAIYLAVLGPQGLRQAAETSARLAHYAANRLASVPGLSPAFPAAPFFKEFAVRVSGADPRDVLARVRDAGIHGGIALGRWFPEHRDLILIAVTEKRTKGEIDALADAYERALAS